MRRAVLGAALVAAMLCIGASAHSEKHIDDSPVAESLEDSGPVEHTHFLDPQEEAEIESQCAVCRKLIVPTLRQAIEASGSDHDAKTVVHDALEELAKTHRYVHDERAVSRKLSAEEEEEDEVIQGLVQGMLWDVEHSRSVYALVDLWHNYSPERRTHFDALVEHAVCACHDDQLMVEPNARLHEYLKEFESAVHSALHKYGGHPQHDPVLSKSMEPAPETFLEHDEDLPHEHESIAAEGGRGEGEQVDMHHHAPHTDSGDLDGHAIGAGQDDRHDEF